MEQEEKKVEVLNINPLSKGKRILLFLADFFLNFIIAFVIFNTMIMPLGKVASSFNNRQNEYSVSLKQRADVLYSNKILFKSNDVDDTDIVYNASFTYFCYLSYFALDDEQPTFTKYHQYGHKEENNTIKHYYEDILGDSEAYYTAFDNYNNKYQYFQRSGDIVTLKTEYKNLIEVYFHKDETISKDGQQILDNIEDSLFYPLYGEVMTLIEKNDLTYGDLSYNKAQSNIVNFNNYYKNLIIWVAFISYVISSAIMYILIPFLNRNRKTLGMMMMRLERVDYRKLSLLKKRIIPINFVYILLTNLAIIFFIPLGGAMTIFEVFGISILFIFSLLGIALSLISMIYLLFDGFNRTLFDLLVNQVYLTNDSLDDIYRARGYEV